MHTKKLPIPLVFILEEINFGGTQKQTIELAQYIDKDIFAPEIWTVRAGEEFLPVLQQARIPVHILRQDSTLRPIPALMALWKKLRNSRPSLIHLCTTFPNIWGRVLGRCTHIPVIVGSCRGTGNIYNQYERFLWPLAHGHVCNATSIQTTLHTLGVPANRLQCIGNGVDTKHFVPAAEGLTTELELVCVGRMVAEKDHQTLLQAFAIVVQTFPQARLHLVGDGPLQENIQNLSKELGLSENILFHGACDNVRDFLQKARILVLSSVAEGMPNVLLEGMACALPIIATKVGGVPDLVQDGRTGLLCAAKDVQCLAKHIQTLLGNFSMAKDLGVTGRERVVQSFSLQSMAKQHEDLYIMLCKQANLL